MGARRTARSPGRPRRLLDPDVHKRLLDATHAGAPMHMAAAHAGISTRTFERWMQLGFDELAARADGQAPDRDAQVYVAFYEEVMAARARTGVRMLAHIQRAAGGGAVIEETTRRYRDPESGSTVEETSVRRSAPDWRAAAWYLERTEASFAKQATLAVTGPDGGAVQVEHHVDIPQLSARIHSRLAELEPAEPDVSVEIIQ